MTRENKIALAINTSVPPKLLAQLAEDEEWIVRMRVANNPSTPLEVLLILMVDEDEDVRGDAETTLNRKLKL